MQKVIINWKEHPKTRKERVLVKGSSKSPYCNNIIEPCYIKSVQTQMQMFFKVSVFENFAKFLAKHLC